MNTRELERILLGIVLLIVALIAVSLVMDAIDLITIKIDEVEKKLNVQTAVRVEALK